MGPARQGGMEKPTDPTLNPGCEWAGVREGNPEGVHGQDVLE